MSDLIRLNPKTPALYQIVEFPGKLFFDLRREAMGDKIAATAVLDWLCNVLAAGPFEELEDGTVLGGRKITVIEDPNGRTPFMLKDYFEHGMVDFVEAAPLDDVGEGLDCHTQGHELPSLWELNSYLATTAWRPRVKFDAKEANNTIVFSILDRADYNQRREMSIDCARETIDLLKGQGYQVIVLMERPDGRIPEALTSLTLRDCIRHIQTCGLFIGGDTGFSHLAAALKKPQVALYPDHIKFGKFSMSKTAQISEWWGLPAMMFTPMNFYPNSKKAHYAEIGTDHRWSPMRVLEIVKWYL